MATRTRWLAKGALAGVALALLASCDRTPTDSDMPGGPPAPPGPSFAVGDLVSTQPLPIPGTDVSIAFDGTRLFYNDQAGTNQLIGFETTDPPTLVTSVTVTTLYPSGIPRAIDLDAMAFDVTRNVLWAVEHDTENIYSVDRVTGLATFAFSATGKCLTCVGSYKDGLAFDAGNPADPTDDALWWSYDVDHEVFKLSIPTGATLESFIVDPIHPDLAACGNSGIAVGGRLLYLATDGCGSIIRVDKVTKAFVDVLATPGRRPEDMECDPVTFAPREVMWVREFEDPNNVIAIEIEPLSCGLGGNPPQAVSTPGKVTGGGRIDPDGSIPVLATLLIQQGPSAGGKATFGFIVDYQSGDEFPTGNLEYNDHKADVRVKATSYDLLVITDPSLKCPVGKHAKFHGLAEVNGAPGQMLEVEVDDCGEPGDMDTFSIKAGAYMASGVLIGGNIQIHED
jgi:hypothetical protein